MKGSTASLWYVDVATGEKKVLVSAAKLASLAPDYNKVKDEREKERLTRYHVAAYLWAPDSKHLIFDSQGSSGCSIWRPAPRCSLLRRPIPAATRNFLPMAAMFPTCASTTFTFGR
jgi:hypothetical protein